MNAFDHIRTITLDAPFVAAVVNNNLIVGDHTNGLTKFPIDDPDNAITNADYLNVTGIAEWKGDIIVASSDILGEVHVLDTRFQYVGKITIGSEAVIRDIVIRDGKLYCAVGGTLVAGVRVRDLVTKLVTHYTAPTCYGVDVDLISRVFIAAFPSYNDSFRIYDYSMKLLSSETQNGTAYGIRCDGSGVIYVPCRTSIDIYESDTYSLITSITEIDGNALVDVQKVAVHDGCLFICDYGNSALYIIRAYYRNEDTIIATASGVVDGVNQIIINDGELLVDDTTTSSSDKVVQVVDTKHSFGMVQI